MRGRVTVVGEALVDLLWRSGSAEPSAVPGGSPANVAIGLHRLERSVTLVTSWGDDPPGKLIGGYLAGTGLDVRRAPGAAGRSTVALAYLAEDGSATYDFLAAWDPRMFPLPADTAVLHSGSLALVVEPGATLVRRLFEAVRNDPSRAAALDLNVRPAVLPDRDAYWDACRPLVQSADVAKASDEDLAWLFPGAEPAEAARELLAQGPRLVVVTLGAGGAMAVTEGTEVRVPAPEVTVVDTVGAGDAFQSALLDAVAGAWIAGGGRTLPTGVEELADVLRRCVAAAALTCERTGADPPTAAELAAALPGSDIRSP